VTQQSCFFPGSDIEKKNKELKKKKKGNITDITKITNYFLKTSKEAVGMEKMCK